MNTNNNFIWEDIGDNNKSRTAKTIMAAATNSRAVALRHQLWLVCLVSILAFSSNNGGGNNSDMMLLAEGFITADVVVLSRRHNPYLHSQSIPLQISTSSVGLRRKNQHRIDLSLFSSIGKINNDDDAGDDGKKKKKKKKKKTQLVISTNLDRDNTSTAASDEIVSGTISATGRIDIIARPKSTKLGVPSKRKMKDLNSNSNNNDRDKKINKRLSMKAQKIKNQRTSGGLINSKSTTNNKAGGGGDDNMIRIVLGKRGSKTVTMIQGMKISLEERKKLLKEIKNKVGGGGTIVDGVLEIQGSHTTIVYEFLVSKGYNNIKK